ncbi:hypothetical protein [Arthrobacter woluwensis]|uniref:hypothetical protein n=1 Tax=Arthrobacter woluwensis TaxID=156980 RepID=UPI000AB654D9|nr:hypothetical protein [Arthrobacter woluwensis]
MESGELGLGPARLAAGPVSGPRRRPQTTTAGATAWEAPAVVVGWLGAAPMRRSG